MFLSKDVFTTVLDSTPLVSIDLLVQNYGGQVLLGQRKNRPAEGDWFVPGGRILKNESLSDAFRRLTLVELGQAFDVTEAILKGPYDHFYSDSVFGESPSTHYVAIAYTLHVKALPNLPTEQHSSYRWFDVDELLEEDNVHEHTKAYFL
ncbi:GDP-mannose mannosyl hydrolase [Aliidiomarina iranensis]|uniref:GDP-mannose mannosyl hydrolase n=1 Tax=Aliidiomarina iranensis TaxID=1434071 RepID=A0A432VT80_9GAMM|nr:GDP-mannose mannosyl hydrolase [Aliidiomarina iranensis]RUO19614.1 GDP-mannose mannosyl hydrolase [Aliidiomarina iranensis]